MKQTVYVYEIVKSLNSQAKIKMFTQEVLSLRNDQFHNLLGTIELDVQPIKKEVLKSTNVPLVEGWDGYCHVSQHLVIPKTAYDVTITYKIEE